MYLCYMDESGDPGVHPRSPTVAYSVAGIFLKDTSWLPAFEDVLNFRRYVRKDFGLRMRDEVKASQLVKGSGPWAPLALGSGVRLRIYRGFMRLQAKMGVVQTFAVVVDKAKCSTTEEVRQLAWQRALNRVERFGHYNNDVVMLIPDVGEYEYRRKMARRLRRFSPVGSRFGGSLLVPMKNLVDDPVERKSHESYFIQLADLNAYAALRAYHGTAKFPSTMWSELDSAILAAANKYSGGTPGVVAAP